MVYLKRRGLTKISIVLSSLDAMVQMALLQPLLAVIAAEFLGYETMVTYSLTITALVMVPSILIAGKLADYFDKRTILIIGSIIFGVFGLIGGISPDATFLFVSRIFLGVGAGLAFPMVPAITAELFRGNERAQVMGFSNAGASIVALLLNLFAGYIGAIYWRLAFCGYIILLPIVLLQFIYIPKLPPLSRKIKGTNLLEKLPVKVYLCAVGMLAAISVLLNFNVTNIFFIADADLGGTILAGQGGAAQTLCSFVMGMVFAYLLRGFKRFTVIIPYLLGAIGYGILALSDSSTVFIVGMMFCGAAMGTLMPYMNVVVANMTPLSRQVMAMSFLALALELGTFLTTPVSSLFILIGGSYAGAYGYVSATLALAAIIILIVALLTNKRAKARSEEHIKKH